MTKQAIPIKEVPSRCVERGIPMSISTILKWNKMKLINTFKVGNRLFITTEELDRICTGGVVINSEKEK